MKGSLSKEQISAFILPLTHLSKVIEDGIVLNVSSSDKSVAIYSVNTQIGTMVHVKYKDVFKDFDIQNDDKLGILSVPQLIKYFSILDKDAVDFTFEDNLVSLNNKAGEVSFKTADPGMIKQGPTNFKGSAWYCDVQVNEKFEALVKAMSILSTEDCILVKGDKNKGLVTFTVRATGVEINKMTVTIPTTVTEDFETIYRKDVFEKVLTSASESIVLSFSDRLVRLICDNKYSNITYYIAKKQ